MAVKNEYIDGKGSHKANELQLIECPRDAMQGWKRFIPTEKKVEYINSLLAVGFDTIDFGSFVSAKAIPQMRDTKEVLKGLQLTVSSSKLLAIVANTRGAEEAIEFDEISYLGFPFSISPTFQQRNTNSTIEKSVERVEEIQNLCKKKGKKMVVYLSMAFGNPYDDVYNEEVLIKWTDAMAKREIDVISLSDTIGIATADQITKAVSTVIPLYLNVQIGVHLHSTPHTWKSKVAAAFEGGCLRFDGALKGYGGCPMANDKLVGNINSEWLIQFAEEKELQLSINKEALTKSLQLAEEVFL
jgi:hydroxymethylglutaryl-CoA lyase